MKTVYVVESRDGTAPVLPRVCVVCGKAGMAALETIQLSDDNSRVDFYLYGILNEPAQGKLLAVPVHDACARALRNASLRRLLAVALAWAAIVAGGLLLGFDAMLGFAIAAIAATPLLYLEFTRRMPIEFWFSGARYCLAFSEHKLAQQVARLNDTDVTEREHAGGVSSPKRQQ